MKMIMFEARRWVVTYIAVDFTDKTSWCYRFMKRHGLSMGIGSRIAQKMPAWYETKIMEHELSEIAAKKKSCFKLGRPEAWTKFLNFLHVPLNRTVDMRGAKSVMI